MSFATFWWFGPVLKSLVIFQGGGRKTESDNKAAEGEVYQLHHILPILLSYPGAEPCSNHPERLLHVWTDRCGYYSHLSSCVKGAKVFRIPRRVGQRLSSWESVQSNHYNKERKPTSTYLTVRDELPDRVATKRKTLITARFHREDYKNE